MLEAIEMRTLGAIQQEWHGHARSNRDENMHEKATAEIQ